MRRRLRGISLPFPQPTVEAPRVITDCAACYTITRALLEISSLRLAAGSVATTRMVRTQRRCAPAAEELLADVAVAGQAQSVAAVDRHHQHVRIQRPAVDDMDFGMQLYPALGPKPWP